ncbi:MAG: 3-phosphoserine/phosphohydroxythreonine transaminase [Lewinellaceae bacterium]|nr:3-phosphoserine/phosphohydroxythreonine transaminase [Lewinellaceae bacterium]
MKIYNFSPGPAVIPPSVLGEASRSLVQFEDTGMSIAEMSHRSPKVMGIVEEASALIRELLGLNSDYEVIWVQGGASSQLAVAPMNLTDPKQAIAVADTGYWATKAIKAAEQICKVEVVASSEATGYDRIPRDWTLPKGVRYFHMVTNETINGTQYREIPDLPVPIVADMTSDFLTRPIPIKKFGVIFASAQKNFGLAGVTCVVIRKDLMKTPPNRVIPTIFDYRTHMAAQSLYHTAPVFPIYVSMLTLRWIKKMGGLEKMAEKNAEKAAVLYSELDRNPVFQGSVVEEDRSVMNVCFRTDRAGLEEEFLKYTERNGVVGIKGFPTVGGFRASIYNAMPLDGVQVLAEMMRMFAGRFG